nr:response regulator transcription factor [Bacteroidota bacterium]
MLSIIIIDDEQRVRETIKNILKLSKAELEIVGEGESVSSGYELISQKRPDLVLLDINLPDGTGFDLLQKFERITFKTIFITAYEEYAINAFKFSALDYLLKPFKAGDLLQAIDKANENIQGEKTELKLKAFLANIDKVKKIVLRTSESMHIVNIHDIVRLESDVNYTRFFLANGEKYLVSKTLKDYDEMLEPSGFFRTHQSHLVNLDHILRYEKTEGGHLIMDDESLVPVSSRKREALFRIFESLC